MQNDAAPPYGISSVDNALRLLLLLASHRPLRVKEAANQLGVARSTAHRLLTMLCFRGFAVQNDDKTYAPGPVFFEAGVGHRQLPDIRHVARPHLHWLREQLDETTHLMVRTGTDVLFLDSVEATQALRVGTRAGITMPAHQVSGGKALLAELSTEQVTALYPQGPPADSPFAPDDMAGFLDMLATTRQRGYGINAGESEPGISAVGACVRDPDGRPVAAISVSAPSFRLTRSRSAAAQEAVWTAIRRIEDALV